jgi:hypothetical protein
MRVAALRADPARGGRKTWEFPIDGKMLSLNADMTLLLERDIGDGGENGFIALQVPLPALAEVILTAGKQLKGQLRSCTVSAEENDYLQGVNMPGLDLTRFVTTVEIS